MFLGLGKELSYMWINHVVPLVSQSGKVSNHTLIDDPNASSGASVVFPVNERTDGVSVNDSPQIAGFVHIKHDNR